MSQAANIALTDVATPTPIVHTFVPSKYLADGETMELVNRSGGIFEGYERLHLRLTEPKGNELYSRSVCKLVLPTLETTAGSTAQGIQAAPKKAYDNYIELVARFHKRSTLQERKNALAMIVDAAGEALVKKYYEDQESMI